MKITYCPPRPVLHPSTLLHFKYEIGPYYGCEHSCHYCYIHNDPETDSSREILVHENFAAQLEEELSDISPQEIFIGMDTDPYQPIEQDLLHTRQALDLLKKRGFPVCILTKSDLAMRDADILAGMQGSSVGTSVSFRDDRVAELFESKAPSTRRRIDMLKRMRRAGIETYALISPIMPLVTDLERLIEMLIPHADTVWFYRLDVKSKDDQNWKNIMRIMQDNFPDYVDELAGIVFDRDHQYWVDLRGRLSEIGRQRGLRFEIHV